MNDLDELMSRDPMELSSQDIDSIIKYHRSLRARRAAGEKPTKPASASVNIDDIRDALVKKPASTFVRRF